MTIECWLRRQSTLMQLVTTFKSFWLDFVNLSDQSAQESVRKEPTFDDRDLQYLCPTKRLPKAKNTCPGPKTPARRFLESFSPQTWRIISLLVTCWSSSSINSRSIFWYLVVVTSPYYGPIHSGGKTIKKCKAKSYFFLFLISRKN